MTGVSASRFVTVLSALLILASGCGAIPDGNSDVELAYLKQISIKEHELVHSFFEKTAIGVYLGAPSRELGPLVAGPRLKVEQPPEFDLSSGVMDNVADGTGFDDDNVACSVSFYRVRQGVAPFSSWHLSRDEKRDFTSGRYEVIEVHVGCAPFDS